MKWTYFFEQLNRIIWGPATLLLFVGTGIFFLIRLKFLPWKNLTFALRLAFVPQKDKHRTKKAGDISPFQSLMTSLGACMGTGNIVGVAAAMVLGGPGALIWMCFSAMTGLPTVFAECVLSVLYRRKNSRGEMCGGPMYVMKYGIGGGFGNTLAIIFSILTIGASFGIGNMTQTNSVAVAAERIWHIPGAVTGIIITAALLLVLLGGIQSIGKVCSIFVPVVSVFYLGAALLVVALNIKNLPQGLYEMLRMAFSLHSVAGGVGGAVTASIFLSMKWGIARGVFSNEAGLGSAPIVAAAAQTNTAVGQGYIHMTGTFFDTVIMCTITGLAISASGVLGTCGSDGQLLTGVELTMKAFESVLGQYGVYVIGIGMICFAFPTLLGWAYYGEKALEFLIDSKYAVMLYRILFCMMCYIGATKSLQLVWAFSDAMNGLMAVPNILCLLLMHREVERACFRYENTGRDV